MSWWTTTWAQQTSSYGTLHCGETDHIANMRTWKKQTWTCRSVRIYCKVTQYCILSWWSLLGSLSWYTLFKSSHCKSFEDQVPLDFIYVNAISTRWRHQMETFSALLAICEGNSPVSGEFPARGPVTRSFGVFCDLRLNKRLSKQCWGCWFETPSRPLWRHCNEMFGSDLTRMTGYQDSNPSNRC